MAERSRPTNPFRFGALARDESFTDRDAEIAELLVRRAQRPGRRDLRAAAVRQDVARRPRCSSTSSATSVLVGQINLMRTPTKEKLAEKLAASSTRTSPAPSPRARGLRRADLPRAAHHADDDRRPRGRLAELQLRRRPPARGRRRDARAPVRARRADRRRARAPGAARSSTSSRRSSTSTPACRSSCARSSRSSPRSAHFYLGSKRHMMERIFNDENEPFWRSAKQIELGPIAPEPFAVFIARALRRHRPADRARGRRRGPRRSTGGHPYATQELCYFLWEETPRHAATAARWTSPSRACCAPSTPTSACSGTGPPAQKLVLQALAREPGRPLSQDYRRRHRLPSASSMQKALEALSATSSSGATAAPGSPSPSWPSGSAPRPSEAPGRPSPAQRGLTSWSRRYCR